MAPGGREAPTVWATAPAPGVLQAAAPGFPERAATARGVTHTLSSPPGCPACGTAQCRSRCKWRAAMTHCTTTCRAHGWWWVTASRRSGYGAARTELAAQPRRQHPHGGEVRGADCVVHRAIARRLIGQTKVLWPGRWRCSLSVGRRRAGGQQQRCQGHCGQGARTRHAAACRWDSLQVRGRRVQAGLPPTTSRSGRSCRRRGLGTPPPRGPGAVWRAAAASW